MRPIDSCARRLLATLVLLLSCFAIVVEASESTEELPQVNLTRGVVEQQAPGQRTWSPLENPVLPPTALRTGPDSFAVLGLPSGVKVRLGSNTVLRLEVWQEQEESGRVRLRLEKGRAYLLVPDQDSAARIELQAGEESFPASSGDEFYVVLSDSGPVIHWVRGKRVAPAVPDAEDRLLPVEPR